MISTAFCVRILVMYYMSQVTVFHIDYWSVYWSINIFGLDESEEISPLSLVINKELLYYWVKWHWFKLCLSIGTHGN